MAVCPMALQYGADTLTTPSTRARELGPPTEKSAIAPGGFAFDAEGATHRGLVRDHNEDQFLVCWLAPPGARSSSRTGERRTDREALMLAVADGIAGLPCGEVASARAVNAVTRHLWNHLWDAQPGTEGADGRILEVLREAFLRAHRRVRDVAGPEGPMGTTLTVALVLGTTLYVAHVGDSRCYLQRGTRLRQLTRDHTLGQLARESGAEEAEAAELDNALCNALGVHAEEEPTVEVMRLELLPGDRILVCSDGLSNYVTRERAATILAGSGASEQLATRLLSAALAGGGGDNVTVAVGRAR